jgi:Multicopper oxidase
MTRPPERWETGRKDTVIAFPGEITRVKAFFDIPGLSTWHCHILEHEDNVMMRPYFIGSMPRDVSHAVKHKVPFGKSGPIRAIRGL